MSNTKHSHQTLVFVYEPSRILLGLKKRGFGAGRWNGFGGKIEEGETPEESAKREVLEEAGLVLANIEVAGFLQFEIPSESLSVSVDVFRVVEYKGEPKETEEMKPQWFSINDIPYNQMWPDDHFWMPMFLKGQKFRGRFLMGEKHEVVSHELELMT